MLLQVLFLSLTRTPPHTHCTIPALPRVSDNLPSSPAVTGRCSRRFMCFPDSWMFPEVQANAESEGEEERRKVRSWGMMSTVQLPLRQLPFPISKAEARAHDGNFSVIPALCRGFQPHLQGTPTPSPPTDINCFPFLGSDMIVRIC